MGGDLRGRGGGDYPDWWKGSGLHGEDEATVEVTPWKGEGADVDQDDLVKKYLDEDASFEQIGLHENLIKGIYEMGFVKPSKIQAAALPQICLRKNGKMGNNMI